MEYNIKNMIRGWLIMKIINTLNRITEKFKDDHLSEYASQCAFFIFLSFIPFLIFAISIIKYINLDPHSIYSIFENIVPSSTYGFIKNTIDEAYNKSVGTLSIAIITLIWAASKGVYALVKGIRTIYNVDSKTENNIIIRLEGIVYLIFFVFMIIAFIILMIFGNSIYITMNSWFFGSQITRVIKWILNIRFSVIIIMFLVFLCIYKFISKSNMTLKRQMPGALFSSVLWYITSWFFSIYIDIFKGFSNTYGSLASIILVMMWLYFAMYIVLIGAELNTLLREFKFKKLT